MYKKIVISVLAFLVLLVPCFAKSAKKNDAEKVKLLFAFWGDSSEVEMKKQLAEEYMKLHPNVTIDCTYTEGSQYPTKLQNWLASGQVPDVLGIASDLTSQFVDKNVFEDLSRYMKKDKVIGLWNQRALNSYKFKGKIIAAPFIYKNFVIAYNKDLFEKANIPYPTENWTEAQMLKIARQLTEGNGAQKIYGIRFGNRPPEFYRNLYGKPVYDPVAKKMNAKGNKRFYDAFTLFPKMINDGISPDETAAQIASGGFETGKYAMQLSATWDMPVFQKLIGDKFKWDVVPLPINEKYKTRWLSTLRGNGWCIYKNSKVKDASWGFIKYMTTEPKAQSLAEKAGISTLTSYVKSDKYLKNFNGGTPYDKMAFVKMLDSSTNFESAGVWAEINDYMKKQYELVVAKRITVKEAIENIQKKGNSILKK